MCGHRVLPALLLVGVILLAACGNGASAAAPPTIRYGVDVSDCGMIISDARFASALVDADGKSVLYDDAGSLAAAVQQADAGLGTRRAWVHDFDGKGWLDATSAYYVASDEMKPKTPMGTGVIAFKFRQQGDSFAADHQGTVMTWDQLVAEWHM